MPDASASLQHAIAAWKLRRLQSDDMPRLALEALAAGLDSPALRILAGADGASWSEVDALVSRIAGELGGPADDHAARQLVADGWLAGVAAGSVDLGWDAELEEMLRELGGDYEWFRLALLDLEVIDAIEDGGRREDATAAMAQRAARALARTPAERLAAPPARDRPFLGEIVVAPRPRRRWWRRR